MRKDQYYKERADRRRNRILGITLIVTLLGCSYSMIFQVLRDGCTRSFDRNPRSVVESYLTAFAEGDLGNAERCWAKYAYYDLGTGCSEICLARNAGTDFTILGVELGSEVEIGTSREQMDVTVYVSCPSGSLEEGIVTLDSVRADVPWKHWRLVASTVGGTLPEPWCGE